MKNKRNKDLLLHKANQSRCRSKSAHRGGVDVLPHVFPLGTEARRHSTSAKPMLSRAHHHNASVVLELLWRRGLPLSMKLLYRRGKTSPPLGAISSMAFTTCAI
ncbi:hypothetical protein QYF36_021041 [Acer negundo]|nr:hypothetical protein QYF36_021041 [Acer negundo]